MRTACIVVRKYKTKDGRWRRIQKRELREARGWYERRGTRVVKHLGVVFDPGLSLVLVKVAISDAPLQAT
jgi:hypothetical protein